MDRDITLLDDLLVGEVEDITLPCAKSLHANETVVSAEIECTWHHGAPDADAATLVATPYQIVGTDVVQRITGHKAGAWYLIWGRVTLSSGRKLVGVGLVYAKDY